MSTHQRTHVKRMITLYKVHRVRTRTHARAAYTHTHTHRHMYTSILHRKPQWQGHGKADVLMVLTNGIWWGGDEPLCPKSVNLPTRHPLSPPLTRVCRWRLSRRSHRAKRCQHWWARNKKVRRGVRGQGHVEPGRPLVCRLLKCASLRTLLM